MAEPAVLVVMGVSGSGKTTVAHLLAERLGWAFQEGDDLHPPANVEKMSAGVPLTDADRAPWLRRIAGWIEAHPHGVVTCSALRRSYRDELAGPGVVFVHLAGTRDTLEERMDHREGHFMPASLLGSQLATLEPLAPDEHGIVVDASQPPAKEAEEIITRLHLA